MASEVGVAYLTILPSAKHFRRNLQREIANDLDRAGREGGEDYGKAFERSAVGKAKRAGTAFGKTFERSAATDVKVDADTSAAGAKFQRFLGRIRGESVTVDVDLDTDSAGRGMRSLRSSAADTEGFLNRSALSLKNMAIFAGGAAAAMAPVAGHAAGIAASLAVPLAAGGGGLTIFGLIAGQAIKTTKEQAKEIEQVGDKLNGLEKGTKDYKETLTEYKALLKLFSPAQQSFIDKQGELKATFQDLLQGESGEDIFRPINLGITALNDALPQTKPLLSAVSRSLTSIADETRDWVNSPGFDKFLGFFEQGSGPAIKTTWQMLKNVGASVGNIVGAIGGGGRGQETLEWIEGLTRKWRRWSAQADEKDHPIQRFVRWMDESGPEVGQSLVTIGEAVAPLVPKVVRLGEALLPIAADVLPPFAKVLGVAADALSKFLEVFNKLPPALQTALIAGRLAGISPVGLIRAGRGGGAGFPAFVPLGGAAATGAVAGAAASGPGRHRAQGRFARMRGGLRGGGGIAALLGLPLAYEGLRGLQGLIEQEPEISAIQRSINKMATKGAGRLPGDFNDLGQSITKLTSDHWWDELDRSMGMFDQQKEEVRGLDRALVAIADRRGLPAARRAFRQVAKSEELTADQTNRLMGLLPQFNRRVNQATPSLNELTRGWNRQANLLRLKVIPHTGKLGDQYNLTRRQSNRLQGAIAASVTGDKKHERQLRHVASALGLNQREVKQLLRQYGNQENWVRQLTRQNRKHDGGLRDIGKSLGLTSRETQQLTTKLKAEEKQNRQTTGTSKLHERQLKQVAEKLGLNQRETQQLINKYKNVPERVDTRAEFHTAEAERKRDAFLRQTKGKFADLGNKTYAIMVNGQSGHGRITEADGGVLNAGSGGRENHVAQIAKPGTWRVWAEDETGGESYIPLAKSKRKRSLDIWAQTGRHLGVEGFADGGIRGSLNTKVNLDMSDAAKAVRELIRSLRSAGGSVPATLAWARRQVGDPYQMGGVGPNVWDCSGFMSGITNHLMGRRPYSRLFATSSFPTSMFARGPGTFMIGSTPNAGGGIGHMAGTLGGVNVESSGGVGVRVGGGARGARDPMFGGNVWHLKPGLIKRVITGGGAGDVGAQGGLNRYERYIVNHESDGNRFANNPDSTAFGIGQLIEANRIRYARRLGLNWRVERGDTGTTNRDAQIAMMRMYMDERYGGPRGAYNFHRRHGVYADGGIRYPHFAVADTGGHVKPGWNTIYNGTGKNETIRTHEQERQVQVQLAERRGRQRLVFDRDSQGELLAYIEEVADHRITRDRLHR